MDGILDVIEKNRFDTTTNTLYFGDLGNQNLDKILKLLDYGGQQGLTENKKARANVSFPSNSDYDETLRRVRDTYNRDGLLQEQKESYNTLYEQAQEVARVLNFLPESKNYIETNKDDKNLRV